MRTRMLQALQWLGQCHTIKHIFSSFSSGFEYAIRNTYKGRIIYNYLSLEPVCWFVLVKLVSLVLTYILGDWNEHGLREVCILFYSELYQKLSTVLKNCFTDWDVAPTSDSICSCGFSQGSQTWVKHLTTSWYLLGKSYPSICH